LGVGAAKSKGTSQSLLAQRVAPPAGEFPGLQLFVFGFIGLSFACLYFGTPWWLWLLALVLLFALLCPMIMRDARAHEALLSEYNLKWLCQRCGEISSISAPKAAAQPRTISPSPIARKPQAAAPGAQWVCASCNGPLHYPSEPCPRCLEARSRAGPSLGILILGAAGVAALMATLTYFVMRLPTDYPPPTLQQVKTAEWGFEAPNMFRLDPQEVQSQGAATRPGPRNRLLTPPHGGMVTAFDRSSVPGRE